MTPDEPRGPEQEDQEHEREQAMGETTNQNGDEVEGDASGPATRVIYVERPGGLTRWWRGCVGRVRGWNEAWTRDAIEAELPEFWRRQVPSSWDTARGRVLVGATALMVVALWAGLVAWLLS